MKNRKPLRILNFFQTGLLFVTLGVVMVQANAQSCPPVPVGGGENITAWIVERDTGVEIPSGSTVAPRTWAKIHSISEAYGQCLSRSYVEGVCVYNGIVYERTVNHTNNYADVVTGGALNGTYFLGNVYGKNPNGTTAFWHVLDTQASNSTGPKTYYFPYAGTYTFRIWGTINQTPCNMSPGSTDTVTITITVSDSEEEAAAAYGPRRLKNHSVKQNALFSDAWRWLFSEPTESVLQNWLS